MANQKDIVLNQGQATPKNITLREMPIAPVSAGTAIYLYQSASAKDVILSNPATIREEPGGSGDATASGSTLTATVSLIAGVATATGGAVASGATLTVTTAIIAGAASGGAAVAGTTVTATTSLVAGSAVGGAEAAGQTLTATTSLIAGEAVGGAEASGQVLTATASLIPGEASAGSGDVTADGVMLTATASLIAGTAVGESAVIGHAGGVGIIDGDDLIDVILSRRRTYAAAKAAAERAAQVATRAAAVAAAKQVASTVRSEPDTAQFATVQTMLREARKILEESDMRRAEMLDSLATIAAAAQRYEEDLAEEDDAIAVILSAA